MLFFRREEVKLTPSNLVIVNIWLPKVNGQSSDATTFIKSHLQSQADLSNSCIGHIALETPNKYASWWPNPQQNEQVEIFKVIGAQNSTYAADCQSEHSPPDLKICLYSLNVNQIEDCFTSIERDPAYGYVLAGDKKITRLLNQEEGQSCCGLAYELLAAGGLLKLSNIYTHLKAKWIVVTPDNFADLLKNAKQQECTIYPETNSFPRMPGEYIPPSSSNFCQIL